MKTVWSFLCRLYRELVMGCHLSWPKIQLALKQARCPTLALPAPPVVMEKTTALAVVSSWRHGRSSFLYQTMMDRRIDVVELVRSIGFDYHSLLPEGLLRSNNSGNCFPMVGCLRVNRDATPEIILNQLRCLGLSPADSLASLWYVRHHRRFCPAGRTFCLGLLPEGRQLFVFCRGGDEKAASALSLFSVWPQKIIMAGDYIFVAAPPNSGPTG